MIVAMLSMRMVKMAGYQVIHMVSVRNGFVSASGAMTVFLGVGIAGMVGCAGSGILRRHFQTMFIGVVLVRLMQMTVVQVVGVPVVYDRGMAATSAVCVRVSFVNLMIGRHEDSPL